MHHPIPPRLISIIAGLLWLTGLSQPALADGVASSSSYSDATACVPEGSPPPLDLPWRDAEQLCQIGWGRTPSGPDFGQPWLDGKPTPAGKHWTQADDDAYGRKVQGFLRNYSYRKTRADGAPGLNWIHDPRWRLTGDWQGCPGQTSGPDKAVTNEVHPAVRIHYSPEVMRWLCDYRLTNPDATAPDATDLPAGAMIVKEMQGIGQPRQIAWQAEGGEKLVWVKASDEFDKVTAPNMTWTIMAKGAGISQDDWFWGYFDGGGTSPESEYNPPINGLSAFAAAVDGPGKPVDKPLNPDYYPTFWGFGGGVVYPNGSFGNYCIYCHGSADAESTFSSLDNMLGDETRYQYGPKAQSRVMPMGQMFDAHLRGAGAENNRLPAGERKAPVVTPMMLMATKPMTDCTATRPVDYAGGFAAPCDRNVPAFEHSYPQFVGMSYDDAWALRLPAQTWDHHLATVGQGANEGPDEFMTSDQCMPCHDVGGSGQRQPNMTVKAMDAQGKTSDNLVNLAEYGEWSASPMGLGGRDPIFYAMLESEVNRAAAEPGLKDAAACIQNTCLHCHGNQGQRQFAADHPGDSCDQLASLTDPVKTGQWTTEDAKKAGFHGKPFLLTSMAAWRDSDSALASYGGLGRDGIACMTCHRIADQDLGQEGTSFSGNFRTGPVDEVYGPFDQDIVTEPMHNALGVTPKLGKQVSGSGLCGSCHAIFLPVFDNQGSYLHSSFEQTTYLEWLNSAFNENNTTVPASDWQSCQDCHMADTYRNPNGHMTTLDQQKIANVEDDTFPEADFLLPTLAEGLERRDYKRHTLYGLNVFMAEYFRQFPFILGVRQQDEMAGSPLKSPLPAGAEASNAGIIPPLLTAREEVLKIARHETADVSLKVVDDGRDSGTLTVDVTVTNLGGHKLPSGVSFRRALIEFQVLDAAGQPLWASGRANQAGILLNGLSDRDTLNSEFLRPGGPAGCEGDYQPHYQTITQPCQVQIYEELSKDSAGDFTTSFIHRVDTIKDNRLLPKGYRVLAEGATQPSYCDPWCMAANPEGVAVDDPDYQGADGVTGTDTVRYQIALSAAQRGQAVSVGATLYSQATSPYFLNQRFSQAQAAGNDDNARRLYYMTSHLNTTAEADDGKPYIDQYRLALAADSAKLD